MLCQVRVQLVSGCGDNGLQMGARNVEEEIFVSWGWGHDFEKLARLPCIQMVLVYADYVEHERVSCF